MSYNIAQSRVASEVRAALPKLVTDAKANAPSDEHEQIELAGQAVSYALEGVHDDDVVELQAYGSNVPSTGNRVFFISVTVRQVRARASESPADTGKPWDPSQGPFARRSASTPSSTASSDGRTPGPSRGTRRACRARSIRPSRRHRPRAPAARRAPLAPRARLAAAERAG
jgi:hypothetical protein